MPQVHQSYPLTLEMERRARLLSLAGDPTRLRILCFMFQYKAATVSEIAKSLSVSVASISHHLQMMKDNGYFTTKKIGKTVRYELVGSAFTTELRRVVCDCACH